MRSCSRIAALLLAACFLPAIALADVSDADRAQARALAVEGQVALDRRDYPTALDRFSRADALIHAPTLLIGVARAHAGMGRLLAAQEAYSRILREGVEEGSPEPFFVALDDARKELERLAPRVPSVTIQVKGAEAPEVTLDGEPMPVAALGVRRPTDPGVHVVRATAPGFLPAEVKVTVAEGTHPIAMVELKPAVQAKPEPTPGPIVTPPPPDEGGSSRGTLTIVALGVGGAGVVFGAVTGILAIGKHGDLEEKCPRGICSSEHQGDLDSYRTMGTLSTVGFIAGGVGLATAAVLILTAPPAAPAQKDAWVRPVIGPGYIGAGGRF